MILNDKRVLIIVSHPLEKIGGIENYNKKLIDILRTNYNVRQIDVMLVATNQGMFDNEIGVCYHSIPHQEFIDDDLLEKKSIVFRFFYRLKIAIKSRSYIYKMIKKNKYDIILDSTLISFPKIRKSKHYFLIQHVGLDRYLGEKGNGLNIGKRILRFLNQLFLKNIFLISKLSNFVVYDKKNADEVRKYNSEVHIYEIPLSGPEKNFHGLLNLEKREKIIYLGRIEDKEKNLIKLMELNNKLMNLIDFYGPSVTVEGDFILQKLKLDDCYRGNLTKFKEKIKILSEHKFLILYSKWEGFSYVLVEALSQGVPIIVKDTFISASFLCNKMTGLLLPPNTSVEEDAILIKKFYSMPIEEYIVYAKNALHFYDKNLTYEMFEEKWMKIFNIFLI